MKDTQAIKEVLTRLWKKSFIAVIIQGVPSLDPETQDCLYRGPKGLKCGVAHLLTPEILEKVEEQVTAVSMVNVYGLGALGIAAELDRRDTREVSLLVDRIQQCHDNAARESRAYGKFITTFRIHMLELATEYRLNITGDYHDL